MTFERVSLERFIEDGGNTSLYDYLPMPTRDNNSSTTYKIRALTTYMSGLVKTAIKINLEPGEVAIVTSNRGTVINRVYTKEDVDISEGHIILRIDYNSYEGEEIGRIVCFNAITASGDTLV